MISAGVSTHCTTGRAHVSSTARRLPAEASTLAPARTTRPGVSGVLRDFSAIRTCRNVAHIFQGDQIATYRGS